MNHFQKDTYWSKDYLLICLSNMLLFFSFQLLLPTLPVYLANSEISKTLIGSITSIITVAAVLVRPITGYALDYFNRRIVVIIGSTIITLSSIAFALSNKIEWTLFISIFLGIGWGIMTVSYQTLVSYLIPSGQQGSGMSTYMLFALISLAIAPFLGGWLITNYKPLILFAATFFFSLISLFISLFISFKKMPNHTSIKEKKPSFISSIFEKTAFFPALLIFLFSIGYGGIISFVNLFGLELGLNNPAIFFMLAYIAAILIRPLASKIFDTKGHSYVLLPGVIVGIASLIILSFATTQLVFVLAAILYGLSFGTVQPFIMAWTVQRALPTQRGAANSTFLVGMDTGIALGSILLGSLAQISGYAMMFQYSTLFLLALLIIYIIYLFRIKRKHNI